MITVNGVSCLGVYIYKTYMSYFPRYPTLLDMVFVRDEVVIGGGRGPSADTQRYIGECLALVEEVFAEQGKLERDSGPMGLIKSNQRLQQMRSPVTWLAGQAACPGRFEVRPRR